MPWTVTNQMLVVVGLAAEAIVVLSLLLFGHHDPRSVALRWFQLGALSTAGVAGWAVTVVRPKVIDARILAAIVVCLAGIVIAAAASPIPTLSWSAVWHAFSAAGTGLLFWHQASRPAGRKNLIALVVILFALVVVTYLVVVASLWREWLALGLPAGRLPLRPANVGGILPIPTWFGDAVVVTAPLALSAMWRTGRMGRVAATAMAVLAGLAILLTATRSIWLLIPVGAVVIVVGGRHRRAGRIMAIAGAVAVVGIVGIAVTGAADQVLRDVDAGRSSAFSSAIQLFTERPIVGGGPGTYGVWRLNDAVPVLSHRAFPNAHNLVLDTMAETGLIGSALWAAAFALIVPVCVSAWRRDVSERPLSVAALAGLVMILGHAMVDVVIEQPGLLLLVLIVASLVLVPPPNAERRQTRALGPWLIAGGVVIGVVSAYPAFRSELAVHHLAEAAASPDAGDRLRRASEASMLAPDHAPIQVQRAAAADAVGDRAAAIASTQQAYEIEGTAQHLITLAWLAESEGDRTRAEALALEAIGTDRLDPFVLLNGVVLLEGDDVRADRTRALTDLLVAEPALTVGPLPDAVDALIPTAREAAIERLTSDGRPEAALVVALSANDRALSEIVLSRTAATDRSQYADVVSAWFGDADARNRLYETTAARPSGSIVGLTWYVASAACDQGEAARWRRAHVILGGQPPSVPGPPTSGSGPALWPTGYPEQVWQVGLPTRPYVGGTWTHDRVSPLCGSGAG